MEGNLVGAITLSCVKEKGLISAVMTHPDYRRRGIGRKLFTRASKKTMELKKEFLWLDVDAQNSAAIKLYENEGFKTYYHYCIYNYKIKNTVSLQNPDSIYLRELLKIDIAHVDQIFEECFPKEYWEYKNRTKELKRYDQSKKKGIISKLLSGKSKCYGIFNQGEEFPTGYFIAHYDKFNKAIEVKSPIIPKKDAFFFGEIIPQLSKIIPEEEIENLSLIFSTHRKELIKNLEKIGFIKSYEMLEMYKTI